MICFVPDKDYGRLQQEIDYRRKGNIVNLRIAFSASTTGSSFTISGQRKGTAFHRRIHCPSSGLDAAVTVMVGDESALDRDEFSVERCNWIPFRARRGDQVMAKIRYKIVQRQKQSRRKRTVARGTNCSHAARHHARATACLSGRFGRGRRMDYSLTREAPNPKLASFREVLPDGHNSGDTAFEVLESGLLRFPFRSAKTKCLTCQFHFCDFHVLRCPIYRSR